MNKILSLVLITLVCAMLALIIHGHGNSLQSIAVIVGIWLIISFFVLVLWHGVCQGVERTKVAIPKRSSLLVFSLAGGLFMYAWLSG